MKTPIRVYLASGAILTVEISGTNIADDPQAIAEYIWLRLRGEKAREGLIHLGPLVLFGSQVSAIEAL